MYAKAVWQDGLAFNGEGRSGFQLRMDTDSGSGGNESGFRPLELLGIGLAGCTAIDVIGILQKKRQDVTAFEVQIEVDRSGGHPNVYSKIYIKYIVTGRGIDPAAVERAIELSRTRYCPATAMLAKAAPIEASYTIIPA